MAERAPEIDPNTPVLIGVAAVQQKFQNHLEGEEAVFLMEGALRDAFESRARDGSSTTTVLADFGVLQQTLISRACQQISSGAANVVLVAGAESKYKFLRAKIAGETATVTVQEGVVPDIVLEPVAELWSQVESAAGLGMPVGYYAIIDSAIRYKRGQSVDQHRDEMADMYARFSEVAAANPDAWLREPVEAAYIREHSQGNRMLAFPAVGKAAAKLSSVSFQNIKLKEIYSCFPSAVRVQLDAFELPDDGNLTVTGAMTFGGGPVSCVNWWTATRGRALLPGIPCYIRARYRGEGWQYLICWTGGEQWPTRKSRS